IDRVARDDIPRRQKGAADEAMGAEAVDARCTVAEGNGAGGVGSDEVALDDCGIGQRGVLAEKNAVAGVARDDVAGGRGRAADRVAGAAVAVDAEGGERSALKAVTDALGAIGADADQVSLDGVVAAEEPDAGPAVAGDDVAIAGERAADDIVARAH